MAETVIDSVDEGLRFIAVNLRAQMQRLVLQFTPASDDHLRQSLELVLTRQAGRFVDHKLAKQGKIVIVARKLRFRPGCWR